MRTISLIFSLICFLEVIILWLHYKNEKTHRGFGWWSGSTLLFSLYFLTFFLQSFETLGGGQDIIRNTILVLASLMIYIGMLRFFDRSKQWLNILIFFVSYLIISIFLFIIENSIIPNVLSALSIAVFSLLTGRLIFLNQFPKIKSVSISFAVIFFFHAFFFLLHGILPFVAPVALSDVVDFMQVTSSCLIVVNVTLWNVGFLALSNQRVVNKNIEAEGKYNLMFNTIPDSLLITRFSDGMFVEANEGFLKSSGYTREEIEGKTTLDTNIWFNPADRQKFIILLTESGYVENLEVNFLRKNGKTLVGLLSASTLELNGELHILSVVHEITSRKKMEEKLRENEEKYRFLTENSGDVIWHINNSYRFDYISPADEALRGYKREEVIGQPIWNFFTPEGIKLVREKLEHHNQEKKTGVNKDTTRFELQLKCKDGSWIWTEVCATPHYDKNGKHIGFHGINRDITERKQLLDELYHQATIDDLTRVPNRRHFMYLAEKELKSAKRYHRPISIIVVDFDNLKRINDTYGHLAGDRALSVFSRIVQQIIREVDVLGRFGGDEFLILLPEANEEQAIHVMERINQVLKSSPIFYQDESFSLSVSSGIASIENWTDTLEDLLSRADDALYEAKENGKNGISTNHSSTDPDSPQG